MESPSEPDAPSAQDAGEAAKKPRPFTWLTLRDLRSPGKYLAAAVALSYLLWTVALVILVVWSQKHKTYGMPAMAIFAMVPLSIIAGWIGPWRQQHIFYRQAPRPGASQIQIYIWRVWSLLFFYLYVKYMQYGWIPLPDGPFRDNFVVIAFVAVGVAGMTQWTFILFLKDHFANVTWPFLGALPLSFGYFSTFFLDSFGLRQFPVIPAWLILIAMILLYTAIVLAGVMSFYGKDRQSRVFIYWIFLLTVGLMGIYTIAATKAAFLTNGTTSQTEPCIQAGPS